MYTPAPPPPGATVAATSTVDLGVVNDANSGRSWLSPTALTPPAGTWSFSDFELLFVSGAYAVTDQLQISATTLLPIAEDMPFFGMLSAKLQVLRSGRVRGAAHAAVLHVTEGSGAAVTIGTLGGALTLCLDDDCHSHLTGYLGAGFADEEQSSVPFVASAALTFRVARLVKIVLEADSAFIAGEIDETANGFLGWYGVRFTSKNIGVDLGFAKPICDGCEDGLVMGFPFVSFTYRAFKGD
ncbi:MAG: hypothetical protein H0X17_16885 [Deltaproteobacteria bacterium]|nr:hypothetical protein [Deltaproteobacteria bacterium]